MNKYIRSALLISVAFFIIVFFFIDGIPSLLIYLTDNQLTMSQIDHVLAIKVRFLHSIRVAGLLILYSCIVFLILFIKDKQMIAKGVQYIYLAVVVYLLCVPLSIYTTYADLIDILSNLSSTKEYVISKGGLTAAFFNNYYRYIVMVIIIGIIYILYISRKKGQRTYRVSGGGAPRGHPNQ